MDLVQYHQFTADLLRNVEKDERVLGLVATGSMAEIDTFPDEWSDHDFFLIVTSGSQEFFRNHFEWLPEAKSIAFTFRETQHGVKALYSSGHLLEFAVFDREELMVARVVRARVLFDRGGVAEQIETLRKRTVAENTAKTPSDEYLFGQFITNLLVGAGRYHRGEKMSAHEFVKQHALGHLLLMIEKHVSSSQASLLDGLNAARRFDFVYADLARELNELLLLNTSECAAKMLDFAETTLHPQLSPVQLRAADIVRRKLQSWRALLR